MAKELMNKNKIEALQKLIKKELIPLINNDYFLLDVPNHNNIGDTLIWEGELQFLKNVNFNCKGQFNMHTVQLNKIKNEVILFHGGGNFGDLWEGCQDFRRKVVTKFSNNRIIIFPQTLHYENLSILEKDKILFNSHKDFTLCVRDFVSYEFAVKHFNKCNVILLPDMAFFCYFSDFISQSKSNKTLLLKRNDKEFGNNDKFRYILKDLENNKINFDILDWPSIELKGISKKIDIYLNVMNTLFSKALKATFLIDNATGLKGKNYKNKRIMDGIKFINNYDTIYSTRLHGFILSVLLDKTVYILDNSYGKNKNFFNTWLIDFENVKLID